MLPVQFRYGMGCCFPHVGGHVHDSLLDGEHHDGGDHLHADTGQHTQGTRSYQLVGVL